MTRTYSAFIDLLQTEMSSKLIRRGKMKCTKYWNEELHLQWSALWFKKYIYWASKIGNLCQKRGEKIGNYRSIT